VGLVVTKPLRVGCNKNGVGCNRNGAGCNENGIGCNTHDIYMVHAKIYQNNYRMEHTGKQCMFYFHKENRYVTRPTILSMNTNTTFTQ